MSHSKDLIATGYFSTRQNAWCELFLYHLERGTGRRGTEWESSKNSEWTRDEFISAVSKYLSDDKMLSTATFESYKRGITLPRGRWRRAIFRVFWPQPTLKANRAERDEFNDALSRAAADLRARKILARQANSTHLANDVDAIVEAAPANEGKPAGNNQRNDGLENSNPYAASVAIVQQLLNEFTNQPPVKLIQEQLIVRGVYDRARTNADILSRFLHATKQLTNKPTIRLYGNFTSLANSRRSEAGSSDYVTLLLEEVALIDEFIRSGYHVRVIASMDVGYILQTWTSKERLLSRAAALTERIRQLEEKYPNLAVAVDTHNRTHGMFVLGNSLVVRAQNPVHDHGYTMTTYDIDAQTIFGDAVAFEVAFAEIKKIEFGTRKSLRFGTFSEYFRNTVGIRLHSAKVIDGEQFKPATYL